MPVVYEVCIDQAEVDRRMTVLLVALLKGSPRWTGVAPDPGDPPEPAERERKPKERR